MANCCDVIFNHGCIDACGTIDFGDAISTGDYVVTFEPGTGGSYKTVIAATDGNPITYTMDGTILQVGYTYIIRIVDENGDSFTRLGETGEEDADCQKFTIENTFTIS